MEREKSSILVRDLRRFRRRDKRTRAKGGGKIGNLSPFERPNHSSFGQRGLTAIDLKTIRVRGLGCERRDFFFFFLKFVG